MGLTSPTVLFIGAIFGALGLSEAFTIRPRAKARAPRLEALVGFGVVASLLVLTAIGVLDTAALALSVVGGASLAVGLAISHWRWERRGRDGPSAIVEPRPLKRFLAYWVADVALVTILALLFLSSDAVDLSTIVVWMICAAPVAWLSSLRPDLTSESTGVHRRSPRLAALRGRSDI